MKIINRWKLKDYFSICEVDQYPDDLYKSQLQEHLMGEFPMFSWRKPLSNEEKEKVKKLAENIKGKYELRVALLKDDELVGWSYGWQEIFDSSSFFMGASLVLPEYRRKGLYSKLVNKVLEITKELGFQSVWSTHIMMNNPVIIAKLKMGFYINGFECNVNYGNLVKLTYHHSDFRQKVANFRAGAIKDDEARNLILGDA